MKICGRTVLTSVVVLSWMGPVAANPGITWKHLSSRNGDLPAPSENEKTQQTSLVMIDVDGDGAQDFAITERTAGPAVVLFHYKKGEGWQRLVVEPEKLVIEAGATAADVDGDGDLDLIAGGDYRSQEVWWWENPFPKLDGKPWKRRLIKNAVASKHHDQMWGDFDGDKRGELIFWNQSANRLLRAQPPTKPRATSRPWRLSDVFVYSTDSQPEGRMEKPEPSWKGVNEHEGLARADIDGDGIDDVVGGGYWFKLTEGKVVANPVDPGYTFTRSAVGQLKKGGRPEIVLVAGDGRGPLMWYEWVGGTWKPNKIADGVQDGHTLDVVDIDGDGNLDIFSAEMRVDGRNAGSKARFFLGDGAGGFREWVVAQGHDWHETKLGDVDGDGDIDIVGKPYNHQTPHVEIWLNQGRQPGK